MNDARITGAVEGLPFSLEMLTNPLYRHRYHDEKGNPLSLNKIRENEEFWKSVGPPRRLNAKRDDPMCW